MRQEKRTQVDETARLHPNHWSSIEVRVVDVSANGFKAECEARVVVGSSVALEMPGIGRVHAHVTWRRGERFGAKFDLPTDISQCEWRGINHQVVLSRLLIQRVQARRSGQIGQELELRRKIIGSLPIKKLRNPQTGSR